MNITLSIWACVLSQSIFHGKAKGHNMSAIIAPGAAEEAILLIRKKPATVTRISKSVRTTQLDNHQGEHHDKDKAAQKAADTLAGCKLQATAAYAQGTASDRALHVVSLTEAAEIHSAGEILMMMAREDERFGKVAVEKVMVVVRDALNSGSGIKRKLSVSTISETG
jgi:hypothetical protein